MVCGAVSTPKNASCIVMYFGRLSPDRILLKSTYRHNLVRSSILERMNRAVIFDGDGTLWRPKGSDRIRRPDAVVSC